MHEHRSMMDMEVNSIQAKLVWFECACVFWHVCCHIVIQTDVTPSNKAFLHTSWPRTSPLAIEALMEVKTARCGYRNGWKNQGSPVWWGGWVPWLKSYWMFLATQQWRQESSLWSFLCGHCVDDKLTSIEHLMTLAFILASSFKEKHEQVSKSPGWWFQIFFYVHPYLGPISSLTNIDSDGLVQPPTSLHLHMIPVSCFDDSSNPECGNQVTCRLPAVGLALNASCPEDNTVREPQVGCGGKAD